MLNSLRRLLALLVLAALAGAGAPAFAASPAPLAAPQAADLTLAARPAYNGAFRPGSWLPILVELENRGVDRTIEVRVGPRSGAQFAARIALPNGGRKAVTIYTYLTPASRRLSVRLLDGDAELASQTLSLQPTNPQARIVGLLTPEGVEPRLPQRLASGAPLVGVPLALADLPEQALGLSGLNALLIEDLPTAELSERQLRALRDWVLRGGQLIVGGGPGLERTLAGLPPELAPAFVAGVESTPPEALFGSAAAGLAAVPLAGLNPRPAEERPPYALPIAGLIGREGAAVEQSLGRGSVAVVAFPLDHPALVGWEGAPLLWDELVRANSELPPGFAPENVTVDGFVEGNMATSLTSLPALQFPPLGPLVALVTAYIILVGPVTYVVLRRLDRQTLGWVVVPALTLLFSGLTYGLGYGQRGGDLVLNQIALVEPLEPIDGAPLARVRSFVGVFSPEGRSYSLATPGLDADTGPLLRPISIQGPWDANAGAAGGLFVQDAGPGAVIDEFAIAQWSMRAVTADTIAVGPRLAARIVLTGDTLSGEATNDGEATLRDVTLLQGDRVLRLGDLAPGETKRGELTRRSGAQAGFGPGAPVSYLVYGEEIDRQSRNGGQPLPAELQQRVRLLDALYNYGPSGRGGQPLAIAWADGPTMSLLPDEVRADVQHSALLTATPRVALADEQISLDGGWLAPRFEGGQTSACFGAQGNGMVLGADPAALRLVLPRDLYGLRLSELTLLTASDMPWQDDMTLELFDWTTGGWEALQMPARQIALDEPARFLSSNGALRVRVGSGRASANFGCVYIDAKLKGALP